jgi:hypothetical protein
VKILLFALMVKKIVAERIKLQKKEKRFLEKTAATAVLGLGYH